MSASKTVDAGRRRSSEGMVVITVLILVFVACLLIGGLLRLAAAETRTTRLALDRQRAELVAESGLDYGLMKMKDVLLDYSLSPHITRPQLQTMLDAIPPPADVPPYTFRTPGGVPAFRVVADSDVMGGVISQGSVARGIDGRYQMFSVVCGCVNTGSAASAVIRQQVQLVGIFALRYGVFYEEDLEILPGPQMDFFGRVHGNADLYLGGPLNFHERVTAHGRILHRRKDDGSRDPQARIKDADGAMVSMKDGGNYIDSDTPDWIDLALQRWDGNVMSGDHGIPHLKAPVNPVDDLHVLIERPLATNDPSYSLQTEREKFANKAGLTLMVASNGAFTAFDHWTNDVTARFTNATLLASGQYDNKPLYAKDAAGAYQMSSNGAYGINQTNFWDDRQNVRMAPVDVHVDKLLEAFPAIHNGGLGEDAGRGIVYVTRDPPSGAGTNAMPCVRIRNGQNIVAPFGLTIASDLPVYVEGDYNTTNTKPALVAGDAVTVLSKAWQDARSREPINDRKAVDTECHLVTMTGNTATTNANYNGGLENVLRFLEKWDGKEVVYRGSIIDLWKSERAVAPWSYGDTYTAPNRDWGYDPMYLTRNPPGMTLFYGLEELEWRRTTWQAEGW